MTTEDSDQATGRNADAVDRAKVHAIRSAIDAKLRDHNVYQQIRELIVSKSECRSSEATGEKCSITELEGHEESLIQDVLHSEIVQQLLQSQLLQSVRAVAEESENPTGGTTDDDRGADEADVPTPTLYVRLAGGRAFVDQLPTDSEDGGEEAAQASSRQIGMMVDVFRVILTFQEQRVSSRDVLARVEPAFDEHFRLTIRKPRTRRGRTRHGGLYEVDVVAPWEALCLVEEPLHVALIKVDVVAPWEALCLVEEPLHVALIKVRKRLVDIHPTTGPLWEELQRDLVATHRCDWRRALTSTLSMVHLPVQLVDRMKVPVGTLDLRLDVLQVKRSAAVARDALAFLNREAMERNTLTHAFHRHAKQWWDDYKSEWWDDYKSEVDAVDRNSSRSPLPDAESKSYSSGPRSPSMRRKPRLVKVFAEDAEGRFRMVCKYLTPLRAPLAIRSPSEAAREVIFWESVSGERFKIANGLATKWSDELSFYLSPALTSYEMERLYGIPQLENDLFQQTIKRFVPDGHTFQGVPLSFTQAPARPVDAQHAFLAMEEHAVARQIVELHKRAAVFGLTVRVFAYPEDIFVVWIMVAATYQSNS
ncbi:hypothetical protein ATCC90586_001304 [Pythium insidiosum]|nr:hypothetical protein ATCC90586_001304 [Pythium insidiosum]